PLSSPSCIADVCRPPSTTPFTSPSASAGSTLRSCSVLPARRGPGHTHEGTDPMVVYLFPGQGAQARGMGADLFDEFVELTRTADAILGYSVRDLCVRDPDGRLNQTRYTQPAIYVANALSYYRLLREGDGPPRAVSGHSLGEYNALLAAEVFDFADGLRLVKKRGELMAEAENGGMAAVLGKTEKEVRDLVREERIDALDVANLNAPKQIVLSGPRGEIEAAKA